MKRNIFSLVFAAALGTSSYAANATDENEVIKSSHFVPVIFTLDWNNGKITIKEEGLRAGPFPVWGNGVSSWVIERDTINMDIADSGDIQHFNSFWVEKGEAIKRGIRIQEDLEYDIKVGKDADSKKAVELKEDLKYKMEIDPPARVPYSAPQILKLYLNDFHKNSEEDNYAYLDFTSLTRFKVKYDKKVRLFQEGQIVGTMTLDGFNCVPRSYREVKSSCTQFQYGRDSFIDARAGLERGGETLLWGLNDKTKLIIKDHSAKSGIARGIMKVHLLAAS